MNERTISNVTPFNISDTMAAAVREGHVKFADEVTGGLATIIKATFKAEGIESIVMIDERLLARASEVCATALDNLGKNEAAFLFDGLGGHKKVEELKSDEKERHKAICRTVIDRRVLWMRSSGSDINHDTLVLLIAAVCWQVDYETSPYTVAHRT